MIGYNIWLLYEATGYQLPPARIRALPLSSYRKFWSFQAIRNREGAHNPAVGRENERIEQILESVFTEE